MQNPITLVPGTRMSDISYNVSLASLHIIYLTHRSPNNDRAYKYLMRTFFSSIEFNVAVVLLFALREPISLSKYIYKTCDFTKDIRV